MARRGEIGLLTSLLGPATVTSEGSAQHRIAGVPPTSSSTPTGSRRTTTRSAIAARLAAGNPVRLLYGAVVSAAVLAVIDETEGPIEVLVSVASVLIVYWFVHVYVEALASRIVTASPATRVPLRKAFRKEASILTGGIPALVVLAVAFLFGASVGTATNLAQWATVVLLAVAGHLGGYRAGLTGWRLAAATLNATLIGVLTIALKTLLHQ